MLRKQILLEKFHQVYMKNSCAFCACVCLLLWLEVAGCEKEA